MDDFPIDLSWAPAAEKYLRGISRQALHSPDTAMRRMKKKVIENLEERFPDEQVLLETLAQAYEWMAPRFDELSGRAVDQLLSDTPRAQVYWDIISAANESHPGSPLIASCEQESFSNAKMRALTALYKGRTCNGSAEEKAHAALDAVSAVMEPYVVYLAKFEVLHFVATERFSPQANMKPGSLCQRLASRFNDPKIVDPDVVHVRNARAHGHFQYLGNRRLQLWNQNRTWSKKTTTSQILRLAEQAFATVCAFERAMQAFVLRFWLNLFGPIVPQMALLIRGEIDPVEVEQINREYRAREVHQLQGLRKFGTFFGRGEDIRPRVRVQA